MLPVHESAAGVSYSQPPSHVYACTAACVKQLLFQALYSICKIYGGSTMHHMGSAYQLSLKEKTARYWPILRTVPMYRAAAEFFWLTPGLSILQTCLNSLDLTCTQVYYNPFISAIQLWTEPPPAAVMHHPTYSMQTDSGCWQADDTASLGPQLAFEFFETETPFQRPPLVDRVRSQCRWDFLCWIS